ncbi:MAG: carboxypeptidase-like regulatory domain-containing protein [Balneolaceae bacterium]|nr:carboxypeptidase-like regulatory domain-containing protein [Balneolaceae bacterium]
MQRLLGLAFTLILLTNSASAQKIITGKIVDAQTLEPLAAAHIIIKDTYKGTIANADGEFTLRVDTFPSTIVVRYLGYQTKEIELSANHEGPIDFLMEEAFLEMQEITVTGEDPAISIMKEVIRRKQIWRENLQNYTVDAYSRQQLRTDTSIVSITESISQAYWDKELGNREVLKSRRQTANIEGSDNFAGVSYLPNFYDDNLDIVEFDVVGITHPNALKFYNFELVDFSKIDDKVIFEIEVTSKRKLQPLFEGTIYVQDEDYALISVRLKPNSVIVFPPPIQDFNMYYEQQFSNFGGEFWLPVDFRMEGTIEVGVPGLRFPPIGFKQVSKLNDYLVNTELPDSIFTDSDWFKIDSTTINKTDSLFTATVDVVPLSKVELEAYDTLDSTATLEKAFRPKGFLTRFIDMDDDDSDSDVTIRVETSSDGTQTTYRERKEPSAFERLRQNTSIDARFNRVDAIYAGFEHQKRYMDRRLRSRLRLGYSLGYEEVSHGVDVSWWPLKKTRRLALTAGYDFKTETRYNSELFNKEILSTMPLFGYSDYFDYYRVEGVFLGGAYALKGYNRRLNARFKYEEHSSIDYKTSYDLFGSSFVQRFNPAVQEGTLSSISVSYESGEGAEAWGVIGADNIKLSVEQSLKAIGSDWNFTQFNIDIYRRYSTFYQRRFIPNSLDIRINAGTFIGELPVQKNGAIDAALGYFTPFGAFRSKRYVPYEGASFAAIHAEHNFRSTPFEFLGIPNAAKSGISLITFGGIGQTWLPEKQKQFFLSNLGYLPSNAETPHAEVGVSISNIFSLFRIDLAYRIDEPGFYPGVALSRLF